MRLGGVGHMVIYSFDTDLENYTWLQYLILILDLI